jgi:lysophospholipid acyltransferase (LPLAT)-like uncharacterized protein
VPRSEANRHAQSKSYRRLCSRKERSPAPVEPLGILRLRPPTRFARRRSPLRKTALKKWLGHHYNIPVPEASTSDAAPPTGLREFTLRQRIVLSLITAVGYWFIRIIGPTLRLSVSFEDGAQHALEDRPYIASFWHSCIIPSAYIFRDWGIRVMTSASYDGEYIAHIIHRFGFIAVRGSSSRNAVAAQLGMRRALEEGWTVAFTLDGPRGPRHKVKPGPVALGRATGLALTTFHAAVDKGIVLNSWDKMVIPMPFSRVLVRVGKLINVPENATDEEMERHTAELQATLDRVCEFSEENVSNVGTGDFPVYRRDKKQLQISD